ncbi:MULTISPECIES: transposase [Streptomyces]|uniref:transposase n=1 Tax=Streptomyces TaxID=1883 RepID=UPI002810C56D|nr:transposase [Streptomyces sp.]
MLEQIRTFYAREPVVLVWDGLSAHWSRGMRAWVAEQDWLILERLPAYAPELNPVELLWSAIKTREQAHLAGDHLADVADAAKRGIHRVCSSERWRTCRRRSGRMKGPERRCGPVAAWAVRATPMVLPRPHRPDPSSPNTTELTKTQVVVVGGLLRPPGLLASAA